MFESGGIMNQGYVDGFPEVSITGHSSPLPYFVHKIEGEVSPNLQSV